MSAAGRLLGIALLAAPFVMAARQEGQANVDPRTPPLPYQSTHASLGPASCASSLCHGAIAEWTGSNVLQNEYVTWSRSDPHAGAARVLRNERSLRIAKNLGLKSPPDQAPVCLDCHAHVPAAERGKPHSASDEGVTCEGCHGPAGGWMAAHAARGANHAANVSRGLYPLERPVERARLCLSCHFGNADRLVTHRMMAAGHPRLSFELETFTHLAPAQHYRVDADYVARKGEPNGARSWATGQAVAVSETMKIVAARARERRPFPELVAYDCHACHHSMSLARWSPDGGPGQSHGGPRLNESNMLMLQTILTAVDPAAAETFAARMADVHRAHGEEGDLEGAASALAAAADRAAEVLAAHPFDDAMLRSLAEALVEQGLAGRHADYVAAEQSVMGLGAVLNQMRLRGLLKDVALANAALRALRETLADDEAFRPAEYQARMGAVRALLAAPAVSR